MKMNKLGISILLLAAIASVVTSEARAIGLDVDNRNPACNDNTGVPFCTITGALDISMPGDTITVFPGDYRLHAEVNTSNLIIIGVGSPTLNFAFSTLLPIITIKADGVRFEGFDVTGVTGAISILGNNNIITHNRVRNTGGTTIQLGNFDAEPVRVANNTVADNQVAGGFAGIAVNGDRNIIVRNQVSRATISPCVFVSGNNNTLKNNRVNDCNFDGFGIFGEKNKIIRNRAIRNFIGFNLSAGFGLSTGFSRKNQLKRNVAIGNTTVGFNDALDGNKRNIYRRNVCKRNGSGGSLPFGLCKGQR